MVQQWSIRQILSRLLEAVDYCLPIKRWIVVGLLLFTLVFSFSPIAEASSVLASLHTYQEKPGQTTFRSKQSLRDRSDRSWQVIVFKRYQDKSLQGLYLRLIGFPGLVTVEDGQALAIATGSSLQWQAPSELDPQTPELPENAAQYNIAEVLNALESDIPLQVDIPLAGGSVAKLAVPPFAVKEWRELAASHT